MATPLFFANAAVPSDALYRAVAETPEMKHVVLDLALGSPKQVVNSCCENWRDATAAFSYELSRHLGPPLVAAELSQAAKGVLIAPDGLAARKDFQAVRLAPDRVA